jgi:hypothetical protein
VTNRQSYWIKGGEARLDAASLVPIKGFVRNHKYEPLTTGGGASPISLEKSLSADRGGN